jgi:hypothetical protein
VLSARIDDGALTVLPGPSPDADLVLECGPELRALMAGEVGPAEAVEKGMVALTGDPADLARLVEVFHIPPMPASA